MYDVIAIGEYLIDFTPSGKGAMDNPRYEMNPGGAPANCLAACTALGGKTAMIGAVGNDLFGRFLRKKLTDSRIDDRYLQVVDNVNTTLVFVSLDERGEREFAFVRNPGADCMLDEKKVDGKALGNARIVHFGSLSMTMEPARTATLELVKTARDKGKTISYDPNYRPSLWKSEQEAVVWMRRGLHLADSVKMSEEEMELLLNLPASRAEEGIRMLLGEGKKSVYITAGERGAYYGSGEGIGFEPGFAVRAADTTGCGDAFTGAVLYMDCRRPEASMREKVRFANAAGALCAARYGGMTAMPYIEEVNALLRKFV